MPRLHGENCDHLQVLFNMQCRGTPSNQTTLGNEEFREKGWSLQEGKPVIKVKQQSQYEMSQSTISLLHTYQTSTAKWELLSLYEEKCLLKCTMNGNPIYILLDTGTQVSIMDLYLPHTKCI